MKPGLYEFGDAKVYIKQNDVMYDAYTMWLMYKDCIVTIDDGQMVLEKQEEGVALDEDDAFMSWTGTEEVTMSIFEIFNVLSIASGGGRDADEAYERGKLEGENKILKQWNESLTGTTTTPRKDEPDRPYSDDWYKVINPNPQPWQQPYKIGTGTGISYNSNQIMGKSSTKTSDLLDEIDGLTDGVEVNATPERPEEKWGNYMRDLYGLDVMRQFAKDKEDNLMSQITGGIA